MTEQRDPLDDFDDELTPVERNDRDRRERVQQIIDDTRKRLREGKK